MFWENIREKVNALVSRLRILIEPLHLKERKEKKITDILVDICDEWKEG